ncbi:unnamed protein product [Thlaspi arvense]|uniref:Uncharacterized protein n=1 Tax=Thlaspi arvense TaxID=13288 RepID=A0AAU9R7J0_THLAR|nr:unnamed protein product [Thlaspi arvense]
MYHITYVYLKCSINEILRDNSLK